MRQITVGELFRASARTYAACSCVEYGQERRSYAEVDEYTDRAALALMNLGVSKGSPVGIWCKDTPDFLYLFLALEKLGAIPVLLNTALGGAELSVLLQKADSQLLFFDDGYKGVEFGQIVEALQLPNAHFIPDFFRSLPMLRVEDRSRVLHAGALVTPEDSDVIIFTSGTSGAAKGVLTSHLARVNVALEQAKTLHLTEKDKLCVSIPMYHCFGLTAVVLAALCCGASLYFPPERRTRCLLEAVSVHGCTILSAVPTLFSAILARTDLTDFDLSALRGGYIGGSLYTQDFFRKVEQALGARMAPSLGQTEATAGLTFLSPDAPDEERVATVGRFMEGLEGRIVDIHTGQPLETGETGEVCIRGYSVMKGYVKDPEQTAKTIDKEGWLHTGDLGWLDEKGLLHLSGRIKELIIRGGENIAPGEIEAIVHSDERVREAKAVAVPDAHYGEEICVCIVPKPGSAPIHGDEIRTLVAAALAEYKVPRYVLLLNSFPRTASGKIALAALQKVARQKLGMEPISNDSF